MVGAFLDDWLSGWRGRTLLAVLVAFPWIAGEDGRFYTPLLMTVFIFATLGHAWNLLAGYCGLLSFGLQVYVGLLILAASTLAVWWLLRSRYGLALTAVRDDEEAAMTVGVDVRRAKTLVFQSELAKQAASSTRAAFNAANAVRSASAAVTW